jgi:hypothetical protein
MEGVRIMSLLLELREAGVPCLAASFAKQRVALAEPYKTRLGQWVVDNGVASYFGDDVAPAGPDADTILLVTTTIAAHVPAAVLPPIPIRRTLRALAKLADGEALLPRERAAINRAKGDIR